MNLIKLFFAVIAFSANTVFAATIVWDQGPATGSYGGSWVNQTDNQNFADNVTFAQNTWVNGMNYFTNFDLSNPANSFHIKVLADATGFPGSVVSQFDMAYTSYTADVISGINQVTFNFAPILFTANQTYWVGVSGNGFEAAQLSLLTPQDGQMAQFSGNTFTNMAGVGDQAFQLTASVPEPESVTMIALGLGLLFAARRRKQ